MKLTVCDRCIWTFSITITCLINESINCISHFIPSPQPTRSTALPGCLPILASQKPAEIGSSPITVFHLPLLCDFSILFTKTYYDCYQIYIYQRKANKIDFTVVSILSMTMHVCNIWHWYKHYFHLKPIFFNRSMTFDYKYDIDVLVLDH